MTSYVLLLSLLHVATACDKVYHLSAQQWNGSVSSELQSVQGGLGAFDQQKILPYPNSTSFDWWYFDALSTSSDNESIVINFLEAGDYAVTPQISGSLIISIVGTFENGTSYSYGGLALYGANITTNDESITSQWKGPGMNMAFEGYLDLKYNRISYNVTLDYPAVGISGSLLLLARAPPRYPCDPNVPGVTEEVSPGLGWANVVPDADATLDLTIGGEHIRFTGNGYHDKNWADRPFTELLDFWYWGRARVGPYSLVWFDLKAPDGGHHQSGYISNDGEDISISCTDASAKAIPWGNNSEYPPKPITGPPEGIIVSFDMGEKGTFVANITTQLLLADFHTYQRYIGPATGGFKDGETFTGKALYEIMHLA
ncbi:hypothetical protein GL218_04529 [Daldinia childiae]|uniref:uncharacterized protein n=1 Tax=Daldinia childiae TaxID=326645 RepID=UPI0014476F69|nr:uncharacterized protein GL218_04529 [Daldinia childiae]KAF3059583.1 hypothetical protein GL218_04529 [Daldinia childiae]